MSISAQTPPGPPDEAQAARLALTSRLAAAFVLDLIAITRSEGHVLDTLLVGAIIQANVQEIGRRADLFVAFARSDELPPDAMRRPVSMNALANSLGLPFETVRRRVKALARDGWCRFDDEGVIVPSEVLAAPQYHADAFRAFMRLQAFYFQLSDLGLLRELPPPSVDLGDNPFPVRAVARLVGAYLLRAVEAVGAMGNLLDGLVLVEMFHSNTRRLPPGPTEGEAPGAGDGDGVSDARRVPVPVTALAARLGMPPETVRRRVTALIERGACVRVPGGLIVPARALSNPRLWPALAANGANLQRLFAALSQLGVLQVWDGLRPKP